MSSESDVKTTKIQQSVPADHSNNNCNPLSKNTESGTVMYWKDFNLYFNIKLSNIFILKQKGFALILPVSISC